MPVDQRDSDRPLVTDSDVLIAADRDRVRAAYAAAQQGVWGLSRVAGTFRRSDLTRAVKAVKAAGEEIARVEIDPYGKIVIITGKGTDTRQANDLDAWIGKHAHTA